MTWTMLHRRGLSLGLAMVLSAACGQLGCSFKSLDYLKNGASATDGSRSYDSVADDPTRPSYGDDASSTGKDTGRAPSDGVVTTGGVTGNQEVGGSDDLSTGRNDGADDAAPTDAIVGAGGAPGTGGVIGTGGRGAGGVAGSGGAIATGGQASGGSAAGSGGTVTGGVPGSGGSSPDASSGPDTSAGKSVLFVVGAIPTSSTDASIQSRLSNNGYAVTLIKDTSLGSNPTVVQNVVLISRSVSSNNIGTKFRTLAKSVMVWEPNLYTEMGFVDGTASSYGSTTATTTSVVVDSSKGALAAGLSGTVVVFTSAQQVGYGLVNAQAIKVASVPNQANQWTVFAYDTAAQMPGLAAPARRMGFFFSQNSPAALNSDGWRLFDAALTWLSGS